MLLLGTWVITLHFLQLPSFLLFSVFNLCVLCLIRHAVCMPCALQQSLPFIHSATLGEVKQKKKNKYSELCIQIFYLRWSRKERYVISCVNWHFKRILEALKLLRHRSCVLVFALLFWYFCYLFIYLFY